MWYFNANPEKYNGKDKISLYTYLLRSLVLIFFEGFIDKFQFFLFSNLNIAANHKLFGLFLKVDSGVTEFDGFYLSQILTLLYWVWLENFNKTQRFLVLGMTGGRFSEYSGSVTF